MPSVPTTNFTVRLDSKLKQDAETLFNELGMTLSGAVNVFLRQAVRVQGIPFEIRKEQPNRTTLAAMKEAIALANDPKTKTYASVSEMMRDTEE